MRDFAFHSRQSFFQFLTSGLCQSRFSVCPLTSRVVPVAALLNGPRRPESVCNMPPSNHASLHRKPATNSSADFPPPPVPVRAFRRPQLPPGWEERNRVLRHVKWRVHLNFLALLRWPVFP